MTDDGALSQLSSTAGAVVITIALLVAFVALAAIDSSVAMILAITARLFYGDVIRNVITIERSTE